MNPDLKQRLEAKWCNWTFWETIETSKKWAIQRDCDKTPLVQQEAHGPYDFDERATLVLSRGDSRTWRAYKSSLQPHLQGTHPPGDACPNCGRHVNGVNPYDDGETWRKT